jgi:DNA polymerase-3 subunit gamma/tau
MVGQSHIVTTLTNALRENRLSHAYLFSGPRGTGKTTAAKILAKAVNCEQGPTAEPCNTCDACVRVMAGAVMDVLEIDAASNRGVEEIREIRDKVKYAPSEVRKKVYIIDEVHMLTTEAFNALLKTLEEPPAHVMFILATTEAHKIPATIQSRCQRFDFRRVALDDQIARISYICSQENLQVDADAVRELARISDGGMRDALSLLDQAASFAQGTITLKDVYAITGGVAIEQFVALATAIGKADVADALGQVDRLLMQGKTADRVLDGLGQFYRESLMVKMMAKDAEPIQRLSHVDVLAQYAQGVTEAQLFRWLDVIQKYMYELRQAVQPRPILEIAVMRCCVSEPTVQAAPVAVATPTVTAAASQAPAAPVAMPQPAAAPAPGPSPVASPPVAPVAPAVPAAKPMGAPASGVSIAKTSMPIEPFVRERDSAWTHEVKANWAKLLERMSSTLVSLKAWLINGQVVAAVDGAVLVAFKHSLHRDTTEKDGNKQRIEEQIAEVYGQPLRLVTIMLPDWEKWTATKVEQPPEELVLVADDEDDGKKAEWIEEAINLFGEDLVKIEDDNN